MRYAITYDYNGFFKTIYMEGVLEFIETCVRPYNPISIRKVDPANGAYYPNNTYSVR